MKILNWRTLKKHKYFKTKQLVLYTAFGWSVKYFIVYSSRQISICILARRGGAEVASWTLDRKIRVRFPAYPHRVLALWWQGGKRRLRTSRCPCRGRLGTLKTPSCPWRGCPAASQYLETGHLSHHYIAEISLNVTLNHNQHNQLNLHSDSHQINIKQSNEYELMLMHWSINI